MPLDFAELSLLRQRNPTWRLLCSDHAPLIASFLEQAFITRNVRFVSAPDLAESLEDTLYALRQLHGDAAFPKTAMEYLNEWASSEKAWLRKFYAQGSDLACFDLTPATEKAIGWLQSLQARAFVGRDGSAEADRRWTNKVTDVRNWFTFAASERWHEDDREHEHYSDSGGKSGGQKEKLAYTILAASLAYQFGLAFGEVRSRSFRFVVIDEAFGRGSDESAEYGLRLFEKLNFNRDTIAKNPHHRTVCFLRWFCAKSRWP